MKTKSTDHDPLIYVMFDVKDSPSICRTGKFNLRRRQTTRTKIKWQSMQDMNTRIIKKKASFPFQYLAKSLLLSQANSPPSAPPRLLSSPLPFPFCSNPLLPPTKPNTIRTKQQKKRISTINTTLPPSRLITLTVKLKLKPSPSDPRGMAEVWILFKVSKARSHDWSFETSKYKHLQ